MYAPYKRQLMHRVCNFPTFLPTSLPENFLPLPIFPFHNPAGIYVNSPFHLPHTHSHPPLSSYSYIYIYIHISITLNSHPSNYNHQTFQKSPSILLYTIRSSTICYLSTSSIYLNNNPSPKTHSSQRYACCKKCLPSPTPFNSFHPHPYLFTFSLTMFSFPSSRV